MLIKVRLEKGYGCIWNKGKICINAAGRQKQIVIKIKKQRWRRPLDYKL